MHINSNKKIYFGWSHISLWFYFNTIDKDKYSANQKKLADNNKRSKIKYKFSTNKEKLANDNDEDLENKCNTNIKSLVDEKNID